MNAFDIRMFLTGYVLSILLCIILMTSLWWQNRKIYPEIILWLADFLLQFTGVLLIALRGILPDFFTIVIANVFIILGNIILYIGLGRYVGKEGRQLHNYVMLAVFTLMHLYLTYVHPDFNLRVVNISIANIYICAQCSWLMLRRAEPHLRPITRITGIVFAVFCLFCVIQITFNLTIPKITNLLSSGFLGILVILTYQILFIALSIALFLMVSRRLSMSLENELFQRKKAERDLKKNLQILRDTGAMAKIGGWEFDVATQDQEWTEEVYRIHEVDMNYKPTARKGIDFYAPTSRPIIELAVQRAIEYQESFDLELEIITAKGNRRWVHAVGKADQEHGKIIGTFQDITERKRAEEQIHLNETRLKSLLNIIQYRTRTTQEFLDYALNEVINLTQSKIGYIYFYYEDRQQFVLNTWSKDVMKECAIANPQTCYELEKTGVWGEAVRQRKPIVLNDFPADHPLKRGYPEGHAPLNKFMTIPVFKEDSIVAVVGVANKASDYDGTDVLQLTLFMEAVWKSVDIKTGEEKLRKSEEKFRQLAEVFPETIFEANMKGDATYANEHGLKLFGLTEEDIAKGVNIFDMVSPRDRKLALERMQSRLQGASERYLEYQAIKKDGSTFYAMALSVPIMVDGIPVGIRGFIMDITERKQAESQREAALEALRENEERIRAITNAANDAIMMMDNKGNISYWNPAAEHILGYTSAEAIGMNLHKLIAPERFLTGHLAAFPEFQKTGKGNAIGKTLELAARRKDGREIDVNLSLSAVKIEGAWHSVGIIQDITEHKQAEAALASLSRQNELILNSAAEGILGLDLQGNHSFVNSAAAKMFGYEVEELIGRPGHSTWHHTKPDGKPYPAEECKILAVHLDGVVRRVSTEVFWRKDGSSFPVEYASTPIYEQGRTAGVVVTFADITERKKTEEQIQHLATHDLLTDLPGLRLANDRLSSALNMARRYKKAVALMFVDLDGFKSVNDTIGHDAGDYVLRQVAQRMLSCVRETDTVARIGGDEFLIIATEINTPENAAQIAKKVIHTVSQPFIFHGQQAIVGTSIGIALFPDHGENVDQLIKQADEAMYKVKNSGKNNFRFVDDTTK
jgi:diguanylate cyclase (GGDEF)-like protein/PAS domain S-box-containing protein